MIPDIDLTGTINSALVDGDLLYLAGTQLHLRGSPVGGVIFFDGVDWQVPTGASGAGVEGPALGLAMFQDELYISGAFTVAGGRPAWHLARFRPDTPIFRDRFESD